MSWDSSISLLKTKLPRPNDDLIIGYNQRQIADIPKFIATIFGEVTRLFKGKLTLEDYRALSPEEAIEYMMSNDNIPRRQFNIQRSELRLYEYLFKFEDEEHKVYAIPVRLFLPYLYEGAIVIDDTRFYLQLPITERCIYRVNDGIFIKVMRAPLQFWRRDQHTYTATNGKTYHDCLITAKAYHRRNRRGGTYAKIKPTPLVLYLLVHYGFHDTVTEVLGLPEDSITFVETDNKNDPRYTYFQVKPDIYLKVDTELVLGDLNYRRFVAGVLYILKKQTRCFMSDVTNTTFYKMILGRNLQSSSTKEAHAASNAESHLESLGTYLDVITKQALADMGIACKDIFELLVTVFFNIDKWLMDYSANDLFCKRIGGVDILLVSLINDIFHTVYDATPANYNKELKYADVKKKLNVKPMTIRLLNRVDSVRPNNDLYNDNVFIPLLIKRLRQSSSQNRQGKKKNINLITAPEHQFHPSFIAIESALAISASNPGITGDINPFAVIDDKGCFVESEMPWYKDIYPLIKYLVNI